MNPFFHSAEMATKPNSDELKSLRNVEDLEIQLNSRKIQLKVLSYFEERIPLSKHGALLKNCLQEKISDITQLEQNAISKIQQLNREKLTYAQ